MGMSDLLVKDCLGHEGIQIILGTYGHLYSNTNFTVAESLFSKRLELYFC